MKFYSCGLRVSELINLKISDLFFNDNLIKILGKGNKERFVPISKIAKADFKLYKFKKNLIKVKKGDEDTF